ncbi:hypothetical protein AURDEDRAFT_102027 [Auricularia subglabra TFB-10046 SS5]|nr:hypothetical protein AURDEDRAFT_102027 [Auricularia subglabra TFB-10046 SS5]
MAPGTPPHPLIDSDPFAGRVVRYFRPSDYAYWAGFTAGVPALLKALDLADPTHAPKVAQRTAMRLGGVLGFMTGFLFAYQRSSYRFWGWTENQREQELDLKELSERARKGLPLYGTSGETSWIQNVAFRNSQYSQLFFHAVPWFNLARHGHHGVDTAKYYEAAGVPVPSAEQKQ